MGAMVDDVKAAARRIFRTEQAAGAFLSARSPLLGGSTPLELLEAGRGDEVVALLARLQAEAPAPEGGMNALFRGWLGGWGTRK
jgi:uncharacterized protein (DUF2384 family)